MVKVKLGDEIVQSKIRFKVRFDFKGNINLEDSYLVVSPWNRQLKNYGKNKLLF